MLYCVGLGLADERDITVRGLEAVKRCSRVYLEAYTSILLCEKEKLEAFYGKSVTVADRELVESGSEEILRDADTEDVAFLVVGDPFGATTHTDLVIRARERKIPVEVIHNASIMNAIGACGLQLYNFGQTVSLVFFTDTWKPASFYDRVQENRAIGLHTLMLLDIKVKEQSIENMARGRLVYEPPRYMSVSQACTQMLEILDLKVEEDASFAGCYTGETLAVGVARVGAADQRIICGTMAELAQTDCGPPLHSLVLVGDRVHPLELEYLIPYAVDGGDRIRRMIKEIENAGR
ncbi:diphthine synthase [Savitreella phatthalungensis]